MATVESEARMALDPRLRFLIGFAGFATLGLFAYCFPYREHGINESFFDACLTGYARIAHAPISLLDRSAIVVGNEIHGRYAIRIIKGCDAMEAKILFASAVLAFPGATWPRKLAATALGLLTLGVVNVLRITSLYYVGIAFPNLVEVLHLEIWPLAIIALAAGLFLVFVAHSTGEAARKA
jgi:exosortase/archaeosortase family protein